MAAHRCPLTDDDRGRILREMHKHPGQWILIWEDAHYPSYGETFRKYGAFTDKIKKDNGNFVILGMCES